MYKKWLISLFLGGTFILLFSLADFSLAKEKVTKEPGDSGDVPIPFGMINKKFELVNDEYYFLEGKIIKYLDQYYFEVDTEVHPYLARNTKELKVYYALKTLDKNKLSFLNRDVKILVRAEAIIKAQPENNYYSYQILLHLLKNSIILKKNISKQDESDITEAQ